MSTEDFYAKEKVRSEQEEKDYQHYLDTLESDKADAIIESHEADDEYKFDEVE